MNVSRPKILVYQAFIFFLSPLVLTSKFLICIFAIFLPHLFVIHITKNQNMYFRKQYWCLHRININLLYFTKSL